MARFGGTTNNNRRVVAGLLSVAITATLSSCGITDTIRPELNQEGLLRVDPSTVVVDFPDSQVNVPFGPSLDDVLNGGSSSDGDSSSDSSSGSSSGGSSSGGTSITPDKDANTSNGFTVNGKMIVDPANFVELPATVVQADSYAKYLEEEVYKPMMEKIDALSGSQRQEGLYFRILYSGYNVNSESGMMERAAPYKQKVSYGCSEVGAASLGAFAIDYLQQISYNSSAIVNARTTSKTILQNFMTTNTPPDGFKSWEDVDWLAASAVKNFPKNQLALWGNERIGATTLGEYMKKLEMQTVGVIPNIRLKVYTSATAYSNLYINRVSTSYVSRYVDMMTSREVDLLFTEFNQFGNRKSRSLFKCYSDAASVVVGYNDGYNKCIVVLATKPDKDLGEVLGGSYNDMCMLVADIKPPTSWQALQEKNPELKIALQGSKGAD